LCYVRMFPLKSLDSFYKKVDTQRKLAKIDLTAHEGNFYNIGILEMLKSRQCYEVMCDHPKKSNFSSLANKVHKKESSSSLSNVQLDLAGLAVGSAGTAGLLYLSSLKK